MGKRYSKDPKAEKATYIPGGAQYGPTKK